MRGSARRSGLARFATIAAIVLAACGGAPSSSSSAASSSNDVRGGEGEGGGTLGAGDDGAGGSSRTPPGCPSRYGEAIDCGGAQVGPCVYPEGTCTCSVPTWCGGAAPPPMPPQWICEARRPPCPADGTPCSGREPGCSLGPCGFDRMVCVDGAWRTEIGPLPP